MPKPMPLLDDGSDEEVNFTINKGYAENYDNWRKKEEMMKLKALGEELGETSSSSEEEDDPVIEKDFLIALSLIKSKDPVIYDKNVTLFKDEGRPKKPKEKKEKPLFMKNYETELLLKTEGRSSDEDDDLPPKPDTKELAELAKSFKTSLDSDEEEGEGGLFQVKSKTKQEKEKEEAEHLQWLKGQKKEIDKETEKKLSYLHNYWNNTELDEGEKFLKDYILNQRYLDTDDDAPTFDDLMEDKLREEEAAEQERFEHKYNYRFEEPDPEFIKRYPRTIGDSLRRVDDRRKIKRDEREERKKKDKEQMKEEIKRLKALKRKEIEEKFFKLKEACGKDEINFDESDIESDFDPDKHDEKMKELFDDDYYAVEEQQKPEFLHEEEIDDEDWDHWTREQAQMAVDEGDQCKEKEESSASENEEAVDRKADFEKEMIDSTRSGRKRNRKKSLFAQLLSQPKPLYDPDGKSFQEYLDEYYNLDCEDIIGDMPVKFKYRKVIPNDFGLTTDEIIAANDKELNKWCSVKKTCQFRKDEEELYDVQAFRKKAQNTAIKRKILTSVYAPPEEEVTDNDAKKAEGETKPKKKRPRKRKQKSINAVSDDQNHSLDELLTSTNDQIETEMAIEMQKSETSDEHNQEVEQSVEIPKRKKHKKKERLGQNASLENCASVEETISHELGGGSGKKIKQKKFDSRKNDVDEHNQEFLQNVDLPKKKKHKKNISSENELNQEVTASDELSGGSIKTKQKKKHKNIHSLEKDMSTCMSLDESINDALGSIKNNCKKLQSIVMSDDHKLQQIQASVECMNELNQDQDSPKKKKKKRKRKSGENDKTDLCADTQKSFDGEKDKSSFQSQNSKNSANGECNEIYEDKDSSQKKKRKRNRKKSVVSDNSSFNAHTSFEQRNEQSKFHGKKSKRLQEKSLKPQFDSLNDKRLAISDSRLAAFDINPKKFKNKIKYS